MGQLLLRSRPGLGCWCGPPRINRSDATPTSSKSPSRSTGRCSGGSTEDLETRTEIVVSTEDDVELRRDLDHQSRPRDAQPRPDELRGSRAGAGRGRPRAPGVLEPVHRDLGAPGAGCADLRAPAAVGRRPDLPLPPAQRPRARRPGDAVRDESRALRRARPHAQGSDRAGHHGPAVEHHRSGARSDRRAASVRAAAARRHGPRRFHHRLCGIRRRRPPPGGEVPRPARRRPGAGARRHAQPDRAAPLRTHHRRHDPVPAPGWPAALRRSPPARRRRRAGEPPRPARAVEVRHFRRHSRCCSPVSPTEPSSRSSAICSRRTSTCAPRD